MGELALRSARDASLARIMRETNDAWHRTLRGLLRRAARAGQLAPGLDQDEVAALIVATLTSMTLPTVASADRMDQAFRQLERLLGLAPSRRTGVRASN
jgi:BetI-type transcriptional repressor, C-terminal